MKAGKKTYINRIKELFKDNEIIDCRYKSGMATEQVCIVIDDLIVLKAVYSPYDEHTFELVLEGNDTSLGVKFQHEIYNYKNVFKETPKREFDTKDDFNKYIDECVSYLNPTIKQLKNNIFEYIKKQISSNKSMKRLLEDKIAARYISTEFEFTAEEMNYLYLKSGNENFLPQAAKDIFLF